MRNDSEPDDSGSSDASSEEMSDEENVRDNRRRYDEDDDMEKLDDQVMKELLGGDSSHNNNAANSSHDMSEEESDDNTTPLLEYDYKYSPDGLVLDQKPLSIHQLERIQNVDTAATKVFKVIQKYGNDASLPSLDPNDDVGNNKHGCWEIDGDSAWANTSLAMEEIVNAREEMIMAWGDEDDDDEGEQLGEDYRDQQDGQQKDPWWKSIISNESTSSMNESGKARRNEQETKEESDGKPLTKTEQDQFQEVHMEWATNAFAEELEALRKGQLETFTTTKRQKKSGAAASIVEEESSTVELDPTQYSFVVASSKGKMGKDANAEAKAAAMVASEEIDVQVLADMLQSGSNVLSVSEKRMLLQARQRATSTMGTNDADTGLTLHEQRKRELGFLVE
mmetsp:Transcript_9003/g.20309  ORF Transcript_9003/g.20309 Transcript_9003/m.20309 type:complete len:394 (-) Transcript_9003:46-1227(-)